MKVVSEGAEMNARLHLAAGEGPHPAVLFLHGFPGGSDLGLPPALCAAGFHVLFLHYRGSWGSEGTFSWSGAVADAHAALAFLRSRAIQYQIDPARIGVVGHSVGGWVAFNVAAVEPDIVATASIAGTNLGRLGMLARADHSIREAMVSAIQVASSAASGPMRVSDPRALAVDVIESAERYDLERHASDFRNRSVLLVGASADEEVPIDLHHAPLVSCFRAAGARRFHQVVLSADHAFASACSELQEVVIRWLRRELASPS